MDEVPIRYRPPLCNPRQGYRPVCWEVQVVSGAQAEVGEEFEVPHGVGAQLEVAGGNAVSGVSTQRAEVGGLDGAGEADFGGVEGRGGLFLCGFWDC